jgi:hypothetical protein
LWSLFHADALTRHRNGICVGLPQSASFMMQALVVSCGELQLRNRKLYITIPYATLYIEGSEEVWS